MLIFIVSNNTRKLLMIVDNNFSSILEMNVMHLHKCGITIKYLFCYYIEAFRSVVIYKYRWIFIIVLLAYLFHQSV